MFDAQSNRLYLNASERIRFFKTITRITDGNERSFCLFLFYTGARISEALSFQAENIDLSNGTVNFRTLKQRGKVRSRAVPVPREFLRLLDEQADTGRLWTFSRSTGWRKIKKQMMEAELEGKKATPRGLRHSHAIACLTNHVPVPVLQRWLGHSKANTTSYYLNFVGEDDRAWARRIWPHIGGA